MDFTFVIVLFLSIVMLFASSIKWSLPFKKYFLIIIISTTLSLLTAFFLISLQANKLTINIVFLISQFIFYVGILLFLFFRDPKRFPPDIPNSIVSPADGTVIYIKKVSVGSLLESEKNGRILIYDELRKSNLAKTELWQIGISLLFTDVHINRSPITGQVILLNHRPGKFLSLRDENAINVNERQTIVIENERITIGLVQIASRLVRRIESYILESQELSVGQKIGMIKFGSQVDLFIPIEKVKDVNVKVGEYIVAGETLIGKFS